MRFGINLRGDLAKLSDAELAARLDDAWQVYEGSKSKRGWWPVLWHSRRGPIRHPWAYRAFYVFSSVAASFLAFSFGGVDSPNWQARMDTHRSICEIHDLTDEIERRVAARQAMVR